MLRAMGCETAFVTNPFMAAETATTLKAEVVFLDIGMPGIDGYELARILRAKHGWEGLKIVAVTAYGADEDRKNSRRAGFDAHVVKPVDPQLIESHAAHALPGNLRREVRVFLGASSSRVVKALNAQRKFGVGS
jgi:CheY-like chemotaxis protein